MFTNMKELGHKGYLEDILEESLTSNAEEMVCNVEEMDKFILFLKSIEGKRLYVEDQQYIKEEFETIGLKLRYKESIHLMVHWKITTKICIRADSTVQT